MKKKTNNRVFQTVAEVQRALFPALHEYSSESIFVKAPVGTGLAGDFGHRATAAKRSTQSKPRRQAGFAKK